MESLRYGSQQGFEFEDFVSYFLYTNFIGNGKNLRSFFSAAGVPPGHSILSKLGNLVDEPIVAHLNPYLLQLQVEHDDMDINEFCETVFAGQNYYLFYIPEHLHGSDRFCIIQIGEYFISVNIQVLFFEN